MSRVVMSVRRSSTLQDAESMFEDRGKRWVMKILGITRSEEYSTGDSHPAVERSGPRVGVGLDVGATSMNVVGEN